MKTCLEEKSQNLASKSVSGSFSGFSESGTWFAIIFSGPHSRSVVGTCPKYKSAKSLQSSALTTGFCLILVGIYLMLFFY